jgi:predicted metalloprotease with PDZ domain
VILAVDLFGPPVLASIRYQVRLEQRKEHRFDVSMTIPESGSGVRVSIPAWDTLYQIRDYAYRVREVRASLSSPGAKSSHDLPVVKIDKQTWQIGEARTAADTNLSGDITVRYTIEWDEPGPFSSQINGHHAFINFAELLMYVPDRRAEESVIVFDDIPPGWKIFTELPPGPVEHSFIATSYIALVDAPAEAGKFEEFEFDSGGVHIRVTVDAASYRKGSLENALKRITAYQLQLFGGPPFKEYAFIFHIGPYSETGAGGGMEHSNSTAIATNSLESAVSVAAHEFFHAWNVKRIRPQTLEPVDFSKEQYTRALWFAEGVSNTYQYYTLERTGLLSKEGFYGEFAEQVCELELHPARTWQSVEESSLDAWFERYDLYNRPDRSIWYYNKGEILGLLLDIEIRQATDNRKSLDDVFRLMNDQNAKKGRTYDDSEGVRAAVEDVAGKSFQDFFRKFVSGVAPIDYNSFLIAAGLNVKLEKEESADLGFWPTRTLNGVVVSAVEAGSGAEAAGVREGDTLLEINSLSFPIPVSAWLRTQSPGQKVKLRVRRESEEKEFTFALGAHGDLHCAISDAPHPTDSQRRIREGILRGATD